MQLPLLKTRLFIIIKVMIIPAELSQSELNACLKFQAIDYFLLLEFPYLWRNPLYFLHYCSLYVQASDCLPSQPALEITQTCPLFQSHSLSSERSAGNDCGRQPSVQAQERKVRNFALSVHKHKRSEVRA